MRYHYWVKQRGAWRMDLPTDMQVDLAERISRTLGIAVPATLSKGYYADYIADHMNEYIGCAMIWRKYDTNEKVIERVKYFLSHCRNGILAITIKTPKEIAKEGASNERN